MVPWEDKCHNCECPPILLLFPHLLLLSTIAYGRLGYPFSQSRPAVLVLSLPSSLCPLSSWLAGQHEKQKKSQHADTTSTAETLVDCQCCFGHKFKVQHNKTYYEKNNSIPAKKSRHILHSLHYFKCCFVNIYTVTSIFLKKRFSLPYK